MGVNRKPKSGDGGGGGGGFTTGTLATRPAPSSTLAGQQYYADDADVLASCLPGEGGVYEWREVNLGPSYTASINDEFNRSGNLLGSTTSDAKKVWDIVQASGTTHEPKLEVATGVARPKAGVANGFEGLGIPTDWSDVEVSVDLVSHTSSWAPLIFRGSREATQGQYNYWAYGFNGNPDANGNHDWWFEYYENGVYISAAALTGKVAAIPSRMSVRAQGSLVIAYVDGVELTRKDDVMHQALTMHGLGASVQTPTGGTIQGPTFDNFKVSPL